MKRLYLSIVAATSAAAACSGGSHGGTDAGAADVAPDAAGDALTDALTDVLADEPGSDAGANAGTCRGTAEPAWLADPSTCLVHFADRLSRPRGMAFAPNGDLFVAQATGSVVVLFDADGDGVSGSAERATFATQAGLNHGIAFAPDGAYLYASSSTTVYRWGYSSGLRAAAGTAEVVVSGIPGSGGHVTRTLLFDAQGRLYVSVGSASNVDQDSTALMTRSQIRRFTLPATLPSGGVPYDQGEVFASGLRNEVGLSIDAEGRVWGVENGRDDLADSDFGGDVHNDNPGEEINRFDGAGASFYGYPFCWSEGVLAAGAGRGAQYGDESIAGTARRTDAWCQDPGNVRPPAFAMPAHWAPLSVMQYAGGVLPADWAGDLFIASHGSWDRAPATGRLVARAHVSAAGEIIAVDPVVGQDDGQGNLRQGEWGVRPVDVRQGPDGALYFSDDLGGHVFRIGRR